ncbi:pantoate--beta-alanine ligase [Amphibiibacter pelophylacis]|uniref:Pantoate--beta-alanine ligase n=1 Tax=Amphibiibacter pelophylacis TaxID=1799477 RepID=A0ACC6P3D5_9BURK
MQTLHDIAPLRARIAAVRRAEGRIAFVPTMGSLHEGHLQLIDEARRRVAAESGGDSAPGLVVASIFVNPLQFGPSEDFDSYPRDLDRDAALLDARGCDLLFAPSVRTMYPVAQTFRVQTPPELGAVLEGAFRPGFFEGVCTVVLKLFNLVQPDVAIFGSKDYQQALIVRHMVQQLGLPLDIVAAPTVRAEDGLALSSRNAYLSADERARAPQLRQTLLALAQSLSDAAASAVMSPAALAAVPHIEAAQDVALQRLRDLGWSPDYVEVRSARDFCPPQALSAEAVSASPEAQADVRWVVLAAARLGKTRLIDNHEWQLLPPA